MGIVDQINGGEKEKNQENGQINVCDAILNLRCD